MTLDVQHDRSASPLATVSHEIYPSPLPSPEHPGDDAPVPAPDTPTAPSFESDCFAGFGSFS
ncbi:hypothetical protein [Methylobacterium sp. Leaf465]|jgi:hypothetical protein|uniref:hypothetical protein n=1 Tax=Methylobacterium sp. Leaf465 TaxID=1736385 RepID=UPI000ABBDE8E|nr:hypothetical protein [Methylobacterium sp. Leaf465]